MQRIASYLAQNITTKQVAQVILASLILGLCSQIKLPLPFTPVPISLQTFFMMWIGATMGAKKGAAAVCLYILEASAGLPFFLGGGSGITYLMGPTFGYIIGFVVQAFIAGLYVDYAKKFSYVGCFAALSVSSAVQLLMGAAWLGFFVGFDHAFAKGVLPFIGVALLKIAMVVPLIAASRRYLRS